MPTETGKPLNEFKRSDSVPPGGVYFYDLEIPNSAPMRFESYKTISDLCWQIRSFCDVNHYPQVEHLEAKVLEYMCDNLPAGFCRESTASAKRILTLTQVKDITSLIFKRAFSRSPTKFLSTLEEADRRAKICSECPLNDRSRCTVCGGILSLVRKLVGSRETSYDPVLGTCSLCGCLLRAKVHVSSEALKASTTKPEEEDIPDFCWLHEVYK